MCIANPAPKLTQSIHYLMDVAEQGLLVIVGTSAGSGIARRFRA
jgi:hypothetical protein